MKHKQINLVTSMIILATTHVEPAIAAKISYLLGTDLGMRWLEMKEQIKWLK